MAGARAVRDRRPVHVHGARQGDPRRQLRADPQPQPRAEARRPALPRLGRAADVPAEGKPAGPLPVHGGRLPVPPRGRRPHPHVRGRRRTRAHQPPLPLRRGRARRCAPVDGVRLDHAVRRRPGRAPGHLRAHRQLRRLDRDARRHEEALFGLRPVRADDLGLDDDQRSRADDPRHVHEYGRRPAGRDDTCAPTGQWDAAQKKIAALYQDRARPRTRATCRRTTMARDSGCSA